MIANLVVVLVVSTFLSASATFLSTPSCDPCFNYFIESCDGSFRQHVGTVKLGGDYMNMYEHCYIRSPLLSSFSTSAPPSQQSPLTVIEQIVEQAVEEAVEKVVEERLIQEESERLVEQKPDVLCVPNAQKEEVDSMTLNNINTPNSYASNQNMGKTAVAGNSVELNNQYVAMNSESNNLHLAEKMANEDNYVGNGVVSLNSEAYNKLKDQNHNANNYVSSNTQYANGGVVKNDLAIANEKDNSHNAENYEKSNTYQGDGVLSHNSQKYAADQKKDHAAQSYNNEQAYAVNGAVGQKKTSYETVSDSNKESKNYVSNQVYQMNGAARPYPILTHVGYGQNMRNIGSGEGASAHIGSSTLMGGGGAVNNIYKGNAGAGVVGANQGNTEQTVSRKIESVVDNSELAQDNENKITGERRIPEEVLCSLLGRC